MLSRLQADTDTRRPRPEDTVRIPDCLDEADRLETEFQEPALQAQLDLILNKAKTVGAGNWPQALWRMPAEESKPVWDAMRVCWPFGRHLAHGRNRELLVLCWPVTNQLC